MPNSERISKPAGRRMSLYFRVLQSQLDQAGASISSKELGARTGVKDAQVRKDLACFGSLGRPGVGYRVAELHGLLQKRLGMDQTWRTVLVGAGNIGRALLAYPRFRNEGFDFVAAFDAEKKTVGKRIAGLAIQPMSEMKKTVKQRRAQIGLIAVPPDAAAEVAQSLVEAGIQGILNFAPIRLQLPRGVAMVNVDFTDALEQLAFEIRMSTSLEGP
ncbi:MAG: redox-sensing transcriptional repressor Rex [Planctomycetes bacterium]|nr:redox-sensing transcriptional repressor Rex [Planctomycetota bacterium]